MNLDGQVRWGILGPGKIANDFRDGAQGSRTGQIVALGMRRPADESVQARFPGCRIHTCYQDLIEDSGVDAIYVALPHALHARWAISAAEAGKHVLCEKPMATSEEEAAHMFAAAGRNDVFMGEAFMYRHHPLIRTIIEQIGAGIIGDVHHVRASFGFAAPDRSAGHRLFSPELGGGAILDLGCYLTSVVRLIAGCADDAVAEFCELRGLAHIGPSGIDERACAVGRLTTGMLAEIACAITVRHDNVLHVMGDKGRIEIDQFWWAGGKHGGTASIRLIRSDGTRETIEVDEPRQLYSFQFEAVNKAIRAGQHEFAFPGTSRADTLGNMRTLDAWRADAGAIPIKGTQ